jgi:glycosyltransferase involved in cell wall biosynthesis
MNVVHVVVIAGIDDPVRPTGGNQYDRRACDGLRALGWQVLEHPVAGPWPSPDPAARSALGSVLAGIPDGSIAVVDGLVASAAPDLLVPEADRVRLVPLLHLPLGVAGDDDDRAGERAVLTAATGIVVTSDWTRRWLEDYGLRACAVHVVEPGVDPAEPAAGTPAGGRLLTVGAVTPGKGYDVLVAALARISDLPWECDCVGSLDVDPGFAGTLVAGLEGGLAGRVRFCGALTASRLDAAYADADLLVLASRVETYGMVVPEALARGLPVVASRVGGVPDAVGHAADGTRPGVLVPPGQVPALAQALGRWLTDPGERARLRRAARGRRETLSGWDVTCARLSRILDQVGALR